MPLAARDVASAYGLGNQPQRAQPAAREVASISVPHSGHGIASGPSSERQSKHAPPRRSEGSTTIVLPQKRQCWYRSSALVITR